MANLTRDKRKTWAVQWRDNEGLRRTIRIGKVTGEIARATCAKIEKLISAHRHGVKPEPELLEWADSLDTIVR